MPCAERTHKTYRQAMRSVAAVVPMFIGRSRGKPMTTRRTATALTITHLANQGLKRCPP